VARDGFVGGPRRPVAYDRVMATARKAPTRRADRPDTNGDGGASRQRLLEAAVACILEKGYYRASSNEIARRAGVTWGVIQYHYGTRERLMLAVFGDACQRLVDHSRSAVITGTTLREQLSSYFDHLMGFYGRPEYLAYMEVNLNLARDPDTSEETMAGLRRLSDDFMRYWVEVPALPARHRGLVFESLRGMILSHHLRTDDTLTPNVDDPVAFQERAVALLDALASYVSAQA
jgi:TetR/AcrR family transcriptional regulator, regulator of cefoperazone and chloramphenicol sensitivity